MEHDVLTAPVLVHHPETIRRYLHNDCRMAAIRTAVKRPDDIPGNGGTHSNVIAVVFDPTACPGNARIWCAHQTDALPDGSCVVVAPISQGCVIAVYVQHLAKRRQDCVDGAGIGHVIRRFPCHSAIWHIHISQCVDSIGETRTYLRLRQCKRIAREKINQSKQNCK